jgi:hypothetical protein
MLSTRAGEGVGWACTSKRFVVGPAQAGVCVGVSFIVSSEPGTTVSSSLTMT